MLVELSIRDVVLIERLDLKFADGGGRAGNLAALTGETGAGKSILLDALGLALGSRGDSALIRHGAAQASVSAVFDVAPEHPAAALLADQGLDAGDGQLLLRRILGRDGRGRAFVNDQPVSVGLLRQIGDELVEIQGQFEQHGLLNPARHRAVLDEFAGLGETAGLLARAHGEWRRADAAHEEARRALDAARADQDYLRHAVDELVRLDPRAGEERALADERLLLRHGAALAEALAAAGGELEAGRGASGALRAAQRLLERNADKAGGRFEVALAALDRAAVEAAEAEAQVEDLRRTLAPDPGRLERVEERLFGLRAAARKYGKEIEELPGLRGAGVATRRHRGRRRRPDEAAPGRRCGAGGLRGAGRENVGRPAQGRDGARQGGGARAGPAQAGEGAVPHQRRGAGRGGLGRARHGPRGVPRQHQSRHPAGPAQPHRIGRRAVALHACAESGAGAHRAGRHAGFR